MAEVILSKSFKSKITDLDKEITALNNQKIKFILTKLNIYPGDEVFEIMLGWKLILVTVMDRQMLLQLNSFCAYVPNLKFVVDDDKPLFSVLEGKVGRRVWKDR